MTEQGVAAGTPAASGHVTRVEREGRVWHIIGTAHVSRASVDEVRAVIEAVQPDAVCVELCPSRLEAMRDEERWRRLDIFQVFREGKALFLLANLALGAWQRRLGDALGVRPGAELLAGIDAAEAIGAEVVLADRDVHVTLKRTWANLGLWQRSKLLAGVLGGVLGGGRAGEGDALQAGDIEAMKERTHVSELMREFARAMPAVKEPLIDERDAWLASSLRAAPGREIVAVVGAGHVDGIVAGFDSPVDRAALGALPRPKWWSGLSKWLLPILLIATFFLGLDQTDGRGLAELALAWILPTSLLSALGALVAGGRPISILSALLSSPITTLHPLIASGMIVGPAEAWARKPTVADAERIHADIQTLRGFFRNPFTRTLIVAVGASLGSAVGAWVGLTWVVSIVA